MKMNSVRLGRNWLVPVVARRYLRMVSTMLVAVLAISFFSPAWTAEAAPKKVKPVLFTQEDLAYFDSLISLKAPACPARDGGECIITNTPKFVLGKPAKSQESVFLRANPNKKLAKKKTKAIKQQLKVSNKLVKAFMKGDANFTILEGEFSDAEGRSAAVAPRRAFQYIPSDNAWRDVSQMRAENSAVRSDLRYHPSDWEFGWASFNLYVPSGSSPLNDASEFAVSYQEKIDFVKTAGSVKQGMGLLLGAVGGAASATGILAPVGAPLITAGTLLGGQGTAYKELAQDNADRVNACADRAKVIYDYLMESGLTPSDTNGYGAMKVKTYYFSAFMLVTLNPSGYTGCEAY